LTGGFDQDQFGGGAPSPDAGKNTPSNIVSSFMGLAYISKIFAYFRYNVRLTFLVESHFQQVGALALYFSPVNIQNFQKRMLGLGDIYNNQFNQAAIMCLPHKFITLGHNGSYEYEMPWICNRAMLPTKKALGRFGINEGIDKNDLFEYDMGFCSVDMFSNSVIPTGAVADFTIRVYIELVNLEFSGYAPTNFTLG
jgi:hypothetical protein